MAMEDIISNFFTALLPALITTVLMIASVKIINPKAYKGIIGKYDQEAWTRILLVFIVNMILWVIVFNLYPNVKDLMPVKFP